MVTTLCSHVNVNSTQKCMLKACTLVSVLSCLGKASLDTLCLNHLLFALRFFITLACLCRHADSAPDRLSGIFFRDSSLGAFAGTHEHDDVREKLCKLHLVACASFFLDIYMHFVLFACVFHIVCSLEERLISSQRRGLSRLIFPSWTAQTCRALAQS